MIWVAVIIGGVIIGGVCYTWGKGKAKEEMLQSADTLSKLIEASNLEDDAAGKIYDGYWDGFVAARLWAIAELTVSKEANEHIIEDMIVAKLKEVEDYLG